MALRSLVGLSCLFFIVQCVVGSGNVNGPVFHEYEGCSQKCEQSFSPHTNPDLPGLKACQRGCRLSLIAAVSGSFNSSGICHRGCRRGYVSDLNLKYACEVGCANNVWDRTYRDMLEQELYSWMMMTSIMYQFQNRFLSRLYNPLHAGSVSVYMSRDGSSAIFVSQEFDVETGPQEIAPQPQNPTAEYKRRGWFRWQHHHWFHCMLMIFAFLLLALFLSTMLDNFSCGRPRQTGERLPEKQPQMKKTVAGVSVPVVPPGKLVEVVVTEV